MGSNAVGGHGRNCQKLHACFGAAGAGGGGGRASLRLLPPREVRPCALVLPRRLLRVAEVGAAAGPDAQPRVVGLRGAGVSRKFD